MLTQEDYDGIGAAVAKAIRGETTPLKVPVCAKCGKPSVVNGCAPVGDPAYACPVCDKAKMDADRERRLAELAQTSAGRK